LEERIKVRRDLNLFLCGSSASSKGKLVYPVDPENPVKVFFFFVFFAPWRLCVRKGVEVYSVVLSNPPSPL